MVQQELVGIPRVDKRIERLALAYDRQIKGVGWLPTHEQ